MPKKKQPSKKPVNTGEDIRKQVIARVEAEGIEHPVKADKDPEIKSRFVRWCVLEGNQLGDGLLYAKICRNKFVFNKASRVWLKWQGQHWELDRLDAAFGSVEIVVDVLINEKTQIDGEIDWALKKRDSDAVDALQKIQTVILKRIKKLRSNFGGINCLKYAHSNLDPIAISGEELDLHPWLLPCSNGVVDLRSGKFRDGRPEEYMFLASPTEWKGLDEPCDRWDRFMLEIMKGNVRMVEYLQRLLGYSVTGLNREHIFPVFSGKGRNGKSKLVEALSFTLGQLAGTIQSEMLLDQRRPRSSQGPSPDVMTLKGLRLAFASETDEGQRFSPGKVKLYTGGDQLVGRYPNDKYEVHFWPTHSLFLLTNHKPTAPPDDFAFWERMHLIPFEMSFVTHEPKGAYQQRADVALGEKLRKEAAGILAWLVRGCLAYQTEGLNPPIDVIEATAEYKRNEDLLADWLEDYCNVSPDEKGQASQLYDHFAKWFKVNISRKKSFSQNRFGRLLKEKFEKIKADGVIFYVGVDLDPKAPVIIEEKS